MEKVQIYVRIRPFLSNEQSNNFISVQGNKIQIQRVNLSPYENSFSNVFTSDYDQKEIFQQIQPHLQNFLDGRNVTIFTYGQTGAGKTYTLIGEQNSSGILPNCIQYIFNQSSTAFSCSLYEIYIEKLYDLLNPQKKALEIRESEFDTAIKDLWEVEVKNQYQALQYAELAMQKRITKPNSINVRSSRSHLVFQFNNLEQKNKLFLIDLAGSEKLYNQEKNQEMTSINKSLSALGQCISALCNSKNKHIPFRNSKLTRILKDSFSGNSYVCLMCCVSPAHLQETIQTLEFASRCKYAKLNDRFLKENRPEIKGTLPKGQITCQDYSELDYKYQQEMKLRKELEKFIKDMKQYDLYLQLSQLKSENKQAFIQNAQRKNQII